MHEALEPTQDPGWLLSHEGYNVLSESAVESRLAFGTDSWACAPPARSVEARPGWPGWAIADGHLGRAATSPACSTCPTPSRPCRHWCLSPTGPACAFCWMESRCWRARAK